MSPTVSMSVRANSANSGARSDETAAYVTHGTCKARPSGEDMAHSNQELCRPAGAYDGAARAVSETSFCAYDSAFTTKLLPKTALLATLPFVMVISELVARLPCLLCGGIQPT